MLVALGAIVDVNAASKFVMNRAESYKRVFPKVLDNMSRVQGQQVILSARRQCDCLHLNPE